MAIWGAPLGTGRAAWAGPGWAIILHYLTPLLLKRASDCSPPSALPCLLLSFTLNYLTHYPRSLQRPDHNWGVSNPRITHPASRPARSKLLTQPINKGTGPTQTFRAEGLHGCCREGQASAPASQLAFASPGEMVSTSPTPDGDLELPQATEDTAQCL